MDIEKLRQLLTDVQQGQVEVDQALERLRAFPYDDMEYARLDLHRALRQGFPEVVFCQNKTPAQVLGILQRLWKHHDRVLATRASRKRITKQLANAAIQSYEAKRATHLADRALGRI